MRLVSHIRLAAVDAHFHGEAVNEVAAALQSYTDDIVWERLR
jgi:hypothetical protein